MWTINNRLVVDYLVSISVFWLKRDGYFKTRKSGTYVWTWNYSENSVKVRILSNYDSIEKSIDSIYLIFPHISSTGGKSFFQEILLTNTRCNLGGQRFWFVCECGRRVGILYLGNEQFACRNCQNLTYQSRNENRRSGLYALFRRLSAYKQIDKLKEQMKRRFYKGKPTRNLKRISKIINKFNVYFHR
jgi:hypothetical protein